MHIRSIFAIARKDTLDILLNKSAVVTLLVPFFLAFLFLFVNTLIGNSNTKILVYDTGSSRVAQTVGTIFAHSDIIEAHSADEVSSAFGADGSQKKTDYAIGLIVPADFVSQLHQNQHPQVALYINGDDVNQQDQGIVNRVLTDYASAIIDPEPAIIKEATINPAKSSPLGDLSKMYIVVAVVSSFIVGTSIVPNLLVEEKERKTLRMLMVSPASFGDMVLGKLLVGLIYQIALSLAILAIMGGLTGSVPFVLLFILLGSIFGLSIGLIAGAVFQTTGALGGLLGLINLAYILPAMFIGPLGSLIGNNVFGTIIKVLPTYYIAHGLFATLQNQFAVGDIALDIAVTLGSSLLLLVIATWLLRRQASVVAAI